MLDALDLWAYNRGKLVHQLLRYLLSACLQLACIEPSYYNYVRTGNFLQNKENVQYRRLWSLAP